MRERERENFVRREKCTVSPVVGSRRKKVYTRAFVPPGEPYANPSTFKSNNVDNSMPLLGVHVILPTTGMVSTVNVRDARATSAKGFDM